MKICVGQPSAVEDEVWFPDPKSVHCVLGKGIQGPWGPLAAPGLSWPEACLLTPGQLGCNLLLMVPVSS